MMLADALTGIELVRKSLDGTGRLSEHVPWIHGRGPLAWPGTNNVAAIVHTIVACEQDTSASERAAGTVTYVIAMMGIKLNAQVMIIAIDQEPAEHAREFEVLFRPREPEREL